MTRRAICSHCHAVNVLTPGVPTYCTACSHRADVCRLDCTCPRCRRGYCRLCGLPLPADQGGELCDLCLQACAAPAGGPAR